MRPSIPLMVLLTLATAGASIASAAPRPGRAEALRTLAEELRRAEALAGSEDPAAEQAFRSALAKAEPLGESLLLARAVDGLAGACVRAGRDDEAIELYRRAIPMWEKLLGPSQPRLAVSLHNLGVLLQGRGELESAISRLTAALAIWEERAGAASPQARNTRRALERARRAP